MMFKPLSAMLPNEYSQSIKQFLTFCETFSKSCLKEAEDKQDYGGGNYWVLGFWTTKKPQTTRPKVIQDYARHMDSSQGNSFASEWSTQCPRFR